MSAFKKLASDTALYGVSTILGRMLYWLMVPLHTRVFPRPGELSSNVELFSYVPVLLLVYTFSLETAFFRYAARQKEDRQKVFNETLSIVLTTSILVTALIAVLSPQIAVWLDYPGQQKFITWVALIVATDAIVSIPFARLRIENKARQFVKAKLINIAVNVLLNVFFLVICPQIYNGEYLLFLQPVVDLFYDPTTGPGYIFLANLLANLVYFPLLLKTFAGFRFQLDKQQVRLLLAYSFPLMLTTLAGNINMLTDRWFLRPLLPDGFYPGLTSEDALGIYGNCYKLSVFMALAIQSFKFAADPFFFSRAEDKNAPGLLADVNKWFIIVCVLIWVGISLNLDWIGLFIGKTYRQGLGVVPILLLANLVLGVYYNIAFWFKLSDKTAYGTLITAIGAGVTVLLNLLLIPIMGYMGCAVAYLASSVVMCVTCYVLGEKHYPVPYDVPSALIYLLSGGLLIYLALQIQISNLWISVPYHLALFVLYIGAMMVIERKTFAPLLVKVRSRGKKSVINNEH
ncbi:oligosaccharide flippase family protein [Larkinella rosea]|uniref:Polysaccharide biosynthesis protein n=1 Tax=Larkinella rosea TaxID=2025312 RepID=A0A3P1BTH3_9BACT|nr:polysaccharide biosynthesis C-terminal domain-containing protein [Larkinella rosea]RRB04322.1 polysaccharide biosynthesis protein [Larkinella rosea]